MEIVKVLMADDEDAILEIMARKVASQGYQTFVAHDGQEAWDQIITHMPDVIVLDITMPKMDGLEVLNRLRTQPPTKKWQPVIIVSALAEMEHIRRGMELEADHYLTKPCRMEDVLKAIRLMVTLIPQRNP